MTRRSEIMHWIIS